LVLVYVTLVVRDALRWNGDYWMLNSRKLGFAEHERLRWIAKDVTPSGLDRWRFRLGFGHVLYWTPQERLTWVESWTQTDDEHVVIRSVRQLTPQSTTPYRRYDLLIAIPEGFAEAYQTARASKDWPAAASLSTAKSLDHPDRMEFQLFHHLAAARYDRELANEIFARTQNRTATSWRERLIMGYLASENAAVNDRDTSNSTRGFALIDTLSNPSSASVSPVPFDWKAAAADWKNWRNVHPLLDDQPIIVTANLETEMKNYIDTTMYPNPNAALDAVMWLIAARPAGRGPLTWRNVAGELSLFKLGIGELRGYTTFFEPLSAARYEEVWRDAELAFSIRGWDSWTKDTLLMRPELQFAIDYPMYGRWMKYPDVQDTWLRDESLAILAHRDLVRQAIRVRHFRVVHGRWPAIDANRCLSEPMLLPTDHEPVDHYGAVHAPGPLKAFVTSEGRLILYSIGRDRIDHRATPSVPADDIVVWIEK